MVRSIVVLAVALLPFHVATSLGRKAEDRPFDPVEIVERVRHVPIVEGETITIESDFYEARFDENGVSLSPRGRDADRRSMTIGIPHRPEIAGGQVVYPLPWGEARFTGSRDGLDFEYSSSWKPFSGTLCETDHTGGIDVLEDAGYVADSRFGLAGEFLIDTTLSYVPAPADQSSPAVAFDGTNYLIVWEDSRSGSSIDIYATLVDQAGTVRDPRVGIAVAATGNDQLHPSVAYGGLGYLVVWEAEGAGSDTDIYGARLTDSGVLLDTAEIEISTATGDQSHPAVVFGDTSFFVVWDDERGTHSDIYGTRVSQAGLVLDTDGVPVSEVIYDQREPCVAFDGSHYFVAWYDARTGSDFDLYGTLVDLDASVLDTTGISICTVAEFQKTPSVAFDGTNYLVAWDDYRGGESDIYAARVTQAGLILDTGGFAVCSASDYQWSTSLAFDGTNFLVTWQDFRGGLFSDVYGTRVSTTGTVLDPGGIPVSVATYDQEYPSVAFGTADYLVVWDDERSGSDSDLYGVRIDQSGDLLSPQDGTVMSTAANDQHNPAMAFDGRNYLIVWDDYRGGHDYDIYGARVDEYGNVLEPSGGFEVSTATGDQAYPAVAFDGENYFVVWQDERSGSESDVYGARIDTLGNNLDPAGVAVCTAGDDQRYPAVSFGDSSYLVVWGDELLMISSNISGARVSGTGLLLDPAPFAISAVGDIQWSPSVSYNGTHFLVVWHDHRDGPADIYGARVDESGTVFEVDGIPVSTASNYQRHPTVAFDGTDWLVVWQDRRNGSHYNIYGARVDSSGTVLDSISGIGICTAPGDQTYPCVAFDGSDYAIAWQDERGGPESDIFGARVSTSGTVVDTFSISRDPESQVSPTLTGGGGTELFVAYSGWADFVGAHPAKTMRIWGTLVTTTIVEEMEPRTRVQTILTSFPNPFRHSTMIEYGMDYPGEASVEIYDITGRLVRLLKGGQQAAGMHRTVWDGTDGSGRHLPAGTYFIRMRTLSEPSRTLKLIMVSGSGK